MFADARVDCFYTTMRKRCTPLARRSRASPNSILRVFSSRFDSQSMQRSDRWPEDYDPEAPRSRPGSRRNSASLSRRSSLKKEKEGKKKSPLNTAPSSSNTTPKKVAKPHNLDFVVTGKQLLKRSDRANSLPGSYHRRPSAESITPKQKRAAAESKRAAAAADASHSSKSRETSLEDDMSLDLSQVSDFEDTNSKYGIKQKSCLATSTPKNPPKNFQKPRSASLQSQMHLQKMESSRRNPKSQDSLISCSRDSVYKTCSTTSNYRYGVNTELDYSSVSPEYSGQSSTDLSPRVSTTRTEDRSQDLLMSSMNSCCISSWQECNEPSTKVEDYRRGDSGEWNNFWANYNNSLAKVPIKSYYDQCPTPYRTENIDVADLEFSTGGSRKRSPDNVKNVNSIIRNEGLHLTPRETQNIIKCAHILGNVLSKAIERRSKEKDGDEEKIQEIKIEKEPEVEVIKKSLTLDLKEPNIPLEVKEEKVCETVMTQTDISLPNTKSAPKIFEKILRQLSRTSLEEGLEKKMIGESKEECITIEVKNDNN